MSHNIYKNMLKRTPQECNIYMNNVRPWNSPVWLAVPYALCISPLKLAISALNACIASSMSDFLTEIKLATGSGELITAWHAFHVKKCPLSEIITKELHLGKYFLKQPQMGKFASNSVVLLGVWSHFFVGEDYKLV